MLHGCVAAMCCVAVLRLSFVALFPCSEASLNSVAGLRRSVASLCGVSDCVTVLRHSVALVCGVAVFRHCRLVRYYSDVLRCCGASLCYVIVLRGRVVCCVLSLCCVAV